MSPKKSLGSNPLRSRKPDPVLAEAVRGGKRASAVGATAAVVFSGRGAEAAFEAGVLAGLASTGAFEADVVTGVSMGALNAALVAGYSGDLSSAAAQLHDIWLDEIAGDATTGRNGLYRPRGDPRSLLEPSRLPSAIADFVGDGPRFLVDAVRHGARVLRSGDDLAPRMLWFADLSVMFSLDPLAALVAKHVDLEAVRKSQRRLRVSTANWVTGRVEVRDGAALGEAGHDHIVAAAARPGIFPSVEVDGAAEVEATAFANSDLGAAVEAGASHLHVPVFLSTRAEADRPASTIDAFDRLLSELQVARLERELSELRARRPRGMTVHVYRGSLGPSVSHGFLDLRRNRIEALFEHGREVGSHHECRGAGCLNGDVAL